MDFWYQNYSKPKLRLKTQLDYENNIHQHIIPVLGKIPLNELTQNDLQQFYTQMKKSGRLNRTDTYGDGLSDRMVRACHTRCRTALDRAVREKLIRINPADGCKLPPQAVNEIQVLTREECSASSSRPRKKDTSSCSWWSWQQGCVAARC